jgi:hypothetical protein
MFGVIIFVTRTFQTEPMFSRWQRSARNQLLFYGGSAEQVEKVGGRKSLILCSRGSRTTPAIKESS